jgi:hypothetical protein
LGFTSDFGGWLSLKPASLFDLTLLIVPDSLFVAMCVTNCLYSRSEDEEFIIHVEQDDIAFDDDDGPAGAGGNQITADEANVLDQIESSYNAQNSMGIDSMDAQAGSFPRSPTAAQPSSSSADSGARSPSV